MNITFFYKNDNNEWIDFNPKFENFVIKSSRDYRIVDNRYTTDSSLMVTSENYNFFKSKIDSSSKIEIRIITGGQMLYFFTKFEKIDEDRKLVQFQLETNDKYYKIISNKDTKVNTQAAYKDAKEWVHWKKIDEAFIYDIHVNYPVATFDVTNDAAIDDLGNGNYRLKLDPDNNGVGGLPSLWQWDYQGDDLHPVAFEVKIEEIAHPNYKAYINVYGQSPVSVPASELIQNQQGEVIFPNATIQGIYSAGNTRINDTSLDDQHTTRAMHFDNFLLYMFQFLDDSITGIDITELENYVGETIMDGTVAHSNPLKHMFFVHLTDLLFVDGTEPTNAAINGYLTPQNIFNLFEKMGILWKIDSDKKIVLKLQQNLISGQKQLGSVYNIDYSGYNLNYQHKGDASKGLLIDNNYKNLAFSGAKFIYKKSLDSEFEEKNEQKNIITNLIDIMTNPSNYDDEATDQYVLLSTLYDPGVGVYAVRDAWLGGVFRCRQQNKELSDSYIYEKLYSDFQYSEIEMTAIRANAEALSDFGEPVAKYDIIIDNRRVHGTATRQIQVYCKKINDFTIFDNIKLRTKNFIVDEISIDIINNIATLTLI